MKRGKGYTGPRSSITEGLCYDCYLLGSSHEPFTIQKYDAVSSDNSSDNSSVSSSSSSCDSDERTALLNNKKSLPPPPYES